MEFYNKHYIRCRNDGCIIDGFSDAFREPTDTDICINEKGGYQFRLFYLVDDPTYELMHHNESVENPSLFDWSDMIPLYKYEDGYVRKRTQEDIEADRAAIVIPDPAPTQLDIIEAQVTYTALMTDTLL